ncbi:hypothetical protein KSP39_PZI008209 [Platanthera zijinensis]|uniref:Thioredoxin domain-containing protein n=1 Tax=Platanthera zijinensis TaxID=2320716 RepID=A0AAP0BN33_9ASPA
MAATQLSSFFSQRSRTLSRLPSSPLGDRGCPLLVPFLRRLEASPFSLITASILTLQISALSRSQTRRTGPALSAWNGLEEAQTSGYQIDEDVPSSIDLLPISSEEQFDSIIAKAQLLEESLIILWMANWCRKCIYLKPKLEKLATDYYPRIRFYCVDVNSVPQKLVNRAGVTKMPTIQLWRGSEKESEVIGGHEAWLVVNEVRKMIEKED